MIDTKLEGLYKNAVNALYEIEAQNNLIAKYCEDAKELRGCTVGEFKAQAKALFAQDTQEKIDKLLSLQDEIKGYKV